MKYCSHCGNELVDEAIICPKCGCSAGNYNAYNAPAYNNTQPVNTNSYSVLSIIGFIFAFISPLIGLICSIIAYKNAVAEGNLKTKSFSKAGIIVSAVLFGLEFVLGILFGVLISLEILSGNWVYYPY